MTTKMAKEADLAAAPVHSEGGSGTLRCYDNPDSEQSPSCYICSSIDNTSATNDT